MMTPSAKTFLQNGLQSLSTAVTYRRGDVEYPINAVPAGVSWNSIERSNGVALESNARDFILRKSELPVTPQPRDEIVDITGTWLVFNQLDNECWRSIADTDLIRVHCRS